MLTERAIFASAPQLSMYKGAIGLTYEISPMYRESPRGVRCAPLRAQCAVLFHAFPVPGEHAPWGGWTLPTRAGGHPVRGQDPPPQDSAQAHHAPATSGRGATQMQKRTYLGLGLGLLLLGL